MSEITSNFNKEDQILIAINNETNSELRYCLNKKHDKKNFLINGKRTHPTASNSGVIIKENDINNMEQKYPTLSEYYKLANHLYKKYNIKNTPDLKRYISRLNKSFSILALLVPYELLTPQDKFLRLYFCKSGSFRFFNSQIDNDECYEFLYSNKFARKAFITWLLRTGFFYRTYKKDKYKDIIENTNSAYVHTFAKLDAYLFNEHVKTKSKLDEYVIIKPKSDFYTINYTYALEQVKQSPFIMHAKYYGFKVNVNEIIKFFNKEKCQLPCLTQNAILYNPKSIRTTVKSTHDGVYPLDYFITFLNYYGLDYIRNNLKNNNISSSKEINAYREFVNKYKNEIKNSKQMINLLNYKKLAMI